MATPIGTIPSGSTFQNLVDVTTARKVVGFPPSQERRSAPMRIYLPEGVARVMALTRQQALQVSYSLQDNRPATRNPHQVTMTKKCRC
jgi:hypothetical protein